MTWNPTRNFTLFTTRRKDEQVGRPSKALQSTPSHSSQNLAIKLFPSGCQMQNISCLKGSKKISAPSKPKKIINLIFEFSFRFIPYWSNHGPFSPKISVQTLKCRFWTYERKFEISLACRHKNVSIRNGLELSFSEFLVPLFGKTLTNL